MVSSLLTKWFTSSRLPNHADNSTIKDDSGNQIHFVHPQEPILVIGQERYTNEYADRMNKAVSEAHQKITGELNEKFGTPRAMQASSS